MASNNVHEESGADGVLMRTRGSYKSTFKVVVITVIDVTFARNAVQFYTLAYGTFYCPGDAWVAVPDLTDNMQTSF